MTVKLRWGLAVVALALAALLLAGPVAEAQKTKGKTRAAETKYLMKGIVQPNCAGAGDLVKDKGPANDKAWDQLAQEAAILNEMGHVLMDDGRCPDKDWLEAAKTLRECSSKLLDAAKAKKLEDAQAAFKALTGACAACHKAHREQK